MVGETNAAIEGALAGGADRRPRQRQPRLDVQPAARRGSIRPRALLQGQKAVVDGRRAPGPDAGFDVALFVGYHARAGHPRGHDRPHLLAARRSRRGWTAARPASTASTRSSSGAWGVPVGLVAGDDALAEEVADWLPWAERVVVKDGGRRHAARLAPPDGRRGPDPGRAPSGRSGGPPPASCELLRVGPPVVIEVDYRARRRGRPRGDRARARSGSATAASASPPTIRSSRIAASWPGTGWPARSTGEGGHGSRRRSGTTGDAVTPYCPA